MPAESYAAIPSCASLFSRAIADGCRSCSGASTNTGSFTATSGRPNRNYFKTQCYASVECDEEPVKYTIDYLGNERLVFSTDFPHVDTKYPKAVERFLQLPIGDKDKRKILWDNCAAYYGIADG